MANTVNKQIRVDAKETDRIKVSNFIAGATHSSGYRGARFDAEVAVTWELNSRHPPNDWNRIESAARERGISPTRLMISTTLEAIDGRQWPRTEAEIYLLRSAMFAAQAIARDMEAAGRGDEIAAIARNISRVAPDLPPETHERS